MFNFPVIAIELFTYMYTKHLEALMLFPPIYISYFICLIVQIICYFIFFDYLKLGVLGCGISQFIAMLSYGSSIFGYMNYYSILPEENFWSFSGIFTNFGETLRISLLSMVTYCGEIMSMSISNLFGSRLSHIFYAKHLICVSLSLLNEAINYGMSNSCCMLVSNYLELKSPTNLRTVIKKLFYVTLIF